MIQETRNVSTRTKVIRRALLLPFAIGVVLILTLLLCGVADLFGVFRDTVGRVFPAVVVLLVYDAGATLLFRVALELSKRMDRSA